MAKYNLPDAQARLTALQEHDNPIARQRVAKEHPRSQIRAIQALRSQGTPEAVEAIGELVWGAPCYYGQSNRNIMRISRPAPTGGLSVSARHPTSR